MVDAAGRTKFAQALRALATGRVTNDYFEDRLLPATETNDDAVAEIYRWGAWSLYSDLHEYRLTGKDALSPAERTNVARWIVFLKTPLPYAWPQRTALQGLLHLLGDMLTFGAVSRRYWRWFRTQGDISVWPFLSRQDYDSALSKPPYLAGGV
jgi:hypothetical protein